MSVLDSQFLNNFLNEGALLSWDEDSWLISAGNPINAIQQNAETRFYVSEFLEEKGSWWGFSQNYKVSKTELKKWLCDQVIHLASKRSSNVRLWLEPEPAEFQAYFNKFQAEYLEQNIKKVVPVIFSRSPGSFSKQEKLQALIQLLELPSSLYAYGFWYPHRGFLGASPELLIDRTHTQFTTMALAGTAPLTSPGLIDDQKQLKEHQYVIRDITKKLASCDLKWAITEEWPVGNLRHLRTWAQGQSQEPIEKLIHLMHPTSALGGYPGPMPFSYLKEFCNPQLRGYFGAPFGFSHKTRELIIVALRNVQWFEGDCYIGSGCGLVAESQFEQEWEELQLKRDFTRKMLNI